jgi:hypothetical protein
MKLFTIGFLFFFSLNSCSNAMDWLSGIIQLTGFVNKGAVAVKQIKEGYDTFNPDDGLTPSNVKSVIDIGVGAHTVAGLTNPAVASAFVVGVAAADVIKDLPEQPDPIIKKLMDASPEGRRTLDKMDGRKPDPDASFRELMGASPEGRRTLGKSANK